MSKIDKLKNAKELENLGSYNMPKAKTFMEFVEMMTEFLAKNKAEFAIYVSRVGALPKDEEQAAITLFSDVDEKGKGDDFSEQFARLASMFFSLCDRFDLNIKEELETFVGAVALSALRVGKKIDGGND